MRERLELDSQAQLTYTGSGQAIQRRDRSDIRGTDIGCRCTVVGMVKDVSEGPLDRCANSFCNWKLLTKSATQVEGSRAHEDVWGGVSKPPDNDVRSSVGVRVSGNAEGPGVEPSSDLTLGGRQISIRDTVGPAGSRVRIRHIESIKGRIEEGAGLGGER